MSGTLCVFIIVGLLTPLMHKIMNEMTAKV